MSTSVAADPPPTRSRSWVKPLAAALAGVLVAGGIGYAASQFLSAAEDDAVKVTPPDAFVYATFFLEPSNRQKMALDDLLGNFPALQDLEHAEAVLDRALNIVLRPTRLIFTRDIKPWIGEQVAVFLSPPSEPGELPDATFLIATDDAPASLEAVRKSVVERGFPAVEQTYKDADYYLSGLDRAAGVVEDFVVVGTEDSFRSVVDAARGESLADTDEFVAATDELQDDRLALYYIDAPGLLRSVAALSPRYFGVLPLAASIDASVASVMFARSNKLVFEAQFEPSTGARFFAAGSGLLRSLPANSWAAAGLSNFGSSMRTLYDRLLLGVGLPVDFGTMAEQFANESGIDIEDDILSWMGDVGIWLQGRDRDTFGGGVVIGTTDRIKSATTVRELGDFLSRRGFPVRDLDFAEVEGFTYQGPDMAHPVNVVAADKVVIAYGEQPSIDALGSQSELGSSDDFDAAADELGSDFTPLFYVDFQDFIAHVEAFAGSLGPLYDAAVKPNLNPLSHVVVGTRSEGDESVMRVVISVD